jgi:ankyrin repeat protein
MVDLTDFIESFVYLGNTLLHLAIQNNEFSAIQFLAKHKIDVNSKNKKV